MSARAQVALPLVHVPAVTAPPTNTMSSAAVAPGGGQAATNAAALSALLAALGAAAPPGSSGGASTVTALQPAVSATMQFNLQSDIAEQQITEGDLGPATYALHTASMPPAGDASIKYHCGVENGKSYRHHAAASHNNDALSRRGLSRALPLLLSASATVWPLPLATAWPQRRARWSG